MMSDEQNNIGIESDSDDLGTCLICGKPTDQCYGYDSDTGGLIGVCETCRADAALGRAVRKIPDMAKLWHADDSQTWYLHPGDSPCLPLGTGTTPEDAMIAAGLMKGEEK